MNAHEHMLSLMLEKQERERKHRKMTAIVGILLFPTIFIALCVLAWLMMQ